MVTDEGKQAENRQQRRREKQRIQELYALATENPNVKDQLWVELSYAVEAYSYFAVRTILQNSPFESKSAYEDINLLAGKVLEKKGVLGSYQKFSMKNPGIMFADYCRGIYRHKALDYVKRKYREQALEKKLMRGEGTGTSKRNGGGAKLPLVPEGGIEDSAPSEWERFIQYYVNTGIHYKANPFHIIYWCYSKVLAIILGKTKCGSADTWAWKQMTGLSMLALSENFKNIFNSMLRVIRVEWGQDYMDKLNAPYKEGRPEKLGEIVLTNEFTQENAKNWVARLDEKVIKAAVDAILESQDTEVIQIACLYQAKKGKGVC